MFTVLPGNEEIIFWSIDQKSLGDYHNIVAVGQHTRKQLEKWFWFHFQKYLIKFSGCCRLIVNSAIEFLQML